jgi:PAS domain S-box-containing protein
MLHRLWASLAPAGSYDDEQLRITHAVRLLTVSSLLGTLPPLFLQWQHGWNDEFWTLFGTQLALLGTLWLNSRGHAQRAVQALTLTGLACSASMIYFSGLGYADPSVLLFPAILATGALVLSKRVYIGLTCAVLLVVSGLVLLQIHGRNPNTRVKANYSDLLVISILLGLISVAIGLLAAALRRSLLKYQRLIQQQGEGILVLDNDGRIRMANPSAAEIFGAPAASLYGRSIQEFIPAEEWRLVEPKAAKCRAGERVSFELVADRPDGARRQLLVTCTPRRNDDASLSGSIVVVRDVTMLREADEKMRLMAHALRSTDNSVCITDINDRIVYVNDAFLQTYGYAESELLGQQISIVRSKRNPPGMADRILPATLKDGWSGELWNRAKGGREFLVSLTTSVVRDEKGKVIATVGVARDLTVRRAVEGALRESERRFRDLLEHSNLAAVTVDLEGRIVFCNDLLLAALGRDRDDVQGRLAADFLAPEFRDEFQRIIEGSIRSGQPQPATESAVFGADGRRRWFQWSNTALREPNGSLAGWACLGFEVTEQRALREQYLQAQKLESIGRLAGGIAHDFNNLLTVITGFGQLMLDQVEPHSPLREHLKMVLCAGDQAATLARHLLTFGRRQVAQAKPLDLNQVIEEARKLLSRVLGEDIQIDTFLATGLRLVMADPNQMHQVLMNLAVNARDAMPRGGRLTISTANADVSADCTGLHPGVPPGVYSHLMVADTGTGMSEEVKRQIFEPFFTTKESGRGTGLGLATVYGIVRQSGGWIRVWSELGRGSAFHVYMPAINTTIPIEDGGLTTRTELSGSETILLVEDQTAVRQFAETALRGFGYKVLPASSGEAAIALAEGYRAEIHLLLTDLVMPGMHGRELAERIVAVRPQIKVLYMTGYSSECPGTSADPEDCILKPLKPQFLAAKVRQVLAS